MIEPCIKGAGKRIKMSLRNPGDRPEQLGSKFMMAAFQVKADEQVVLKKVGGSSLLPRDALERQRRQKLNTVTREENGEVSDIDDAEDEERSMDDLWRQYPRLCERKFPGVKHYCVDDLGLKDYVDCSAIPCRPLAPAVEDQIQAQIQEFVEIGAVEEVARPPTILTPLIPVPQKGNKKRVVMSFRALNSATVSVQGIPIDRMCLLGHMPKKTVWSVIDMRKGFMQVPLAPEIRTFFGVFFKSRFFQYKTCFFGWVSSMGHFQKALSITLSRIVKKLNRSSVLFYYVGDLMLGSDTPEEHLRDLNTVFSELGHDGWWLNAEKSK